MGKADSKVNEKVESSMYLIICGTRIGSYASQLALTNEQHWSAEPTS